MNDSKVISSVGSGTVWKWSNTQSDSNPSASAWRVRVIVRAQASAGSQPSYSPFQPCGINNPTCIPTSHRACERSMVPQMGGCRAGRVVRPVRAGSLPMLPAMDATDFDPTAPLPGPPDPWAGTDTPSRRDGPPFHMTDMIAAEPAVAERIVAAGAARGSAGHGARGRRPVRRWTRAIRSS